MAKNNSPLEKDEQAAFFEYASLLYGRFPELRQLLFATRSGAWLHGNKGQRAAQVASAKKQGAKNGVADILCLVPRQGYHGLAIEMKRKTGGKVSEDQDKWLGAAEAAGYYSVVANGADEAIETLNWYLGVL